jgi:hypothetical protein
MRRLWLFAVTLLALCLACSASSQPVAKILIQINKPTQSMTVSVDGQVRYRWPVSPGSRPQTGSYTPFRMELMHYSQEWDNAYCRLNQHNLPLADVQ